MIFNFEPDDATRYRMMIELDPTEAYIYIASQFNGIIELPADLIEEAYPHITSKDEWIYHFLIHELTDKTGNPWTARAILIAAHYFLNDKINLDKWNTFTLEKSDYEHL